MTSEVNLHHLKRVNNKMCSYNVNYLITHILHLKTILMTNVFN